MTSSRRHVSTIAVTDIRVGDAVYHRGDFLGIAARIDENAGPARRPRRRTGDQPGPVRVRVSHPWHRSRHRHRRPLWLAAPVRRLSYWEKVSAAADARQDVETLRVIAATESEDDFMLALARNPVSTDDILDTAAKHHAFHVREAVLAHPNTADVTVQRILDNAIDGEAEAHMRILDEGVSPMQSQYIWEADQHALIAVAARARLAGVGV